MALRINNNEIIRKTTNKIFVFRSGSSFFVFEFTRDYCNFFTYLPLLSNKTEPVFLITTGASHFYLLTTESVLKVYFSSLWLSCVLTLITIGSCLLRTVLDYSWFSSVEDSLLVQFRSVSGFLVFSPLSIPLENFLFIFTFYG